MDMYIIVKVLFQCPSALRLRNGWFSEMCGIESHIFPVRILIHPLRKALAL
jgi:hypothetical protein